MRRGGAGEPLRRPCVRQGQSSQQRSTGALHRRTARGRGRTARGVGGPQNFPGKCSRRGPCPWPGLPSGPAGPRCRWPETPVSPVTVSGSLPDTVTGKSEDSGHLHRAARPPGGAGCGGSRGPGVALKAGGGGRQSDDASTAGRPKSEWELKKSLEIHETCIPPGILGGRPEMIIAASHRNSMHSYGNHWIPMEFIGILTGQV